MNEKSTAGANTIAEILSEPATWKSCLDSLEKTGELKSLNEKLLKNVEWVFVGCGSSFYLAQAAASTWAILTGVRSRAIPASEIMLFPELLPLPCQPVLISRSGHTSEILQVAEYLERKLKVRTLAITCGKDTPFEKIAPHRIKLLAADEKSTVMTRSFTSMLLALQSLAAIRGNRPEFLEALRQLPHQTAEHLNGIHATIKSLVSAHTFADYVFLGQGPFFGIAQESMLKVKEMSCSYAQCFHTLEFRHGPKAIVSPETLVTFHHQRKRFRCRSRRARGNQKSWRDDAGRRQFERFRDSPFGRLCHRVDARCAGGRASRGQRNPWPAARLPHGHQEGPQSR